MLFKIVDDWKQFLPPEDEKRLNDVLRSVAKHRNAYRASKDVKVAQLWCALLEMQKQNQVLYKKIKRMEFVFEGIAERMKEEVNEREILEALEKF
ncbi:MAG: hypothetical protein J4400_05340 [Candidatus Aenigmarchaeota archaeon]|nr:hypothetical protein [Candidatus Aenigmarchaeota archaeon]